MNKLAVFFICLVIFAVSFSGTFALRISQSPKSTSAPFSPQPAEYKLEPPASALAGKVTQVSGDVQTIPRDQEDAVAVTQDMEILQGQELTTRDGEASLQFGQASVTLQPDTIISISSTDPAHFLIGQEKGSAAYQTDEVVKKISIRSLDGLFAITDGKAEVTTDLNAEKQEITLVSGSGEFGYINSENKTQIVKLEAGKTLLFNNEEQTVQIK